MLYSSERPEPFEDKIKRFEAEGNHTYADEMRFTNTTDASKNMLYHGIRFNPLERLECIFKTGMVLPLNRVPRSFDSMNGETLWTCVFDYGIENANMGEYVSVMPYDSSIEFNTFIKNNIYLAFRGDINAVHTHYLSYEEYKIVKNIKGLKALYSYANHEYFVKDGISLNNLCYIGIDSLRQSKDEIDKIIELIKFYKIMSPLIDIRTGCCLFDFKRNIETRLICKKRNF